MNRDKVSLGRKQCKNTLTSEVTSLSPLKMTCLLCEQLPLQILEIWLNLLRKRNIFYLVQQLKSSYQKVHHVRLIISQCLHSMEYINSPLMLKHFTNNTDCTKRPTAATSIPVRKVKNKWLGYKLTILQVLTAPGMATEGMSSTREKPKNTNVPEGGWTLSWVLFLIGINGLNDLKPTIQHPGGWKPEGNWVAEFCATLFSEVLRQHEGNVKIRTRYF